MRYKEFFARLLDLEQEFKDVSGPHRAFIHWTCALAITDAAKKQSTNEDEWIELCRMTFRKIRSEPNPKNLS